MATVRDLTHDVLDVITTHQLLHYVKNGETRALRFVTGATTAGLAYAVGPRLQDLFHTLPDRDLASVLTHDRLRLAGLAVASGAAGYVLGSRVDPTSFPVLDERIRQALEVREKEDTGASTAMLDTSLTVASALWLGYSVLYNRKDRADRHQQYWGLGGAAVGYLWGPELLRYGRAITIGEDAHGQIIEQYKQGFKVLGALGGAGVGLFLGLRKPEDP